MADLPQGNDLTGGCRTCKTTKESLSAHNQDIVTTLHYHHITDEEILKISHETIMSRRDQLCTEYGKIGQLLKLTCELFSREGEDNFIEIWKNFEIPKRCYDYAIFVKPVLKESSIKHNETAMIQQRIDAFRKFTSDSYEELQQCLEEEFSILPKVFVNFVNLPNIHVNMHLLMHAKTFGILINAQVADGEDKYSTEVTEQVQDDDDDTKIISPVNFISNISLKKRMSKQERDKLLLTLHNFKTELFLSYVDMKFEAALINSSISWYKFASYMIEEENGILSKVHLHLDDFITIYEEDHEESYAIIKAI
ncbi:hypothetical protein GLOIN_2v1790940 [Rhizophagus irregularis DAOM 181602=DAOM 197198]|nr:hypothetical protein GLOIN_2v1790940 [Rhizophagus irregularis DAOM 181602=DAOM 197198]